MKARVYLLTIGTTLSLVASAAGATAAGPTSAQRSLQAVVLGDGGAAPTKPVGTIRGVRKTAGSSAEPNYFQVRRNSI
jgi:hypothetical protein